MTSSGRRDKVTSTARPASMLVATPDVGFAQPLLGGGCPSQARAMREMHECAGSPHADLEPHPRYSEAGAAKTPAVGVWWPVICGCRPS